MRNSTSIAAMLLTVCLVLLGVCSSSAEERVPMTNELLEKLLKEEFGDKKVEGRPGAWQIDLSEEKDEESENDEGDDGAEEEIGCQPRAIDDADESAEEEEKDKRDGQVPSDDATEDSDDAGDKSDDDELFALDKDDQIPAVVIVLTDTNADRMRIMMPIRKFDPTRKAEDLQLALIALHSNFDRALDARYATQNGILWSAFIHPLESLTAKDVKSGLVQVRSLRKNTGTSYTSSELLFGGAARNAP